MSSFQVFNPVLCVFVSSRACVMYLVKKQNKIFHNKVVVFLMGEVLFILIVSNVVNVNVVEPFVVCWLVLFVFHL